MKKQTRITTAAGILSILLLLLSLPATAAEEGLPDSLQSEPEQAQWTVLFYLCGSNLESKYSYATGNLEEIASCYTYEAAKHIMRGIYDETESGENRQAEDAEQAHVSPRDVNVVIETGGCSQWHTQELGMEIDKDHLQRWHYQAPDRLSLEQSQGSFVMDEKLPLADMATAETLSDFIRWGTQAYPADKYALVLWDHGGGSKTGILIDELFDGDVLHLDELHDALEEGGVTFETVLFDACMMANLETACAIRDHAHWMVASEEMVAGAGTAMAGWLQQLYYTPQWDGEHLGRWICEMTQAKYAQSNDTQAQDTLTWSVIDLSKIGEVAERFDEFFRLFGRLLIEEPLSVTSNAYYLRNGYEFGLGDNNMYDLPAIFYQERIAGFLPRDLYDGMLGALMEAVVYNTHGNGRSGSMGLSFCYAADFSPAELDEYARNCPSPHYLAFLDAIHPQWTAPDEVYEKVERIPEIEEMEEYGIGITKHLTSEGIPAISIDTGYLNVSDIRVVLLKEDKETGQTIRLGSAQAQSDFGSEEVLQTLDHFWMWPAIEGVHCDAELVSGDFNQAIYNIPVRIGTEVCILRCEHHFNSGEMEDPYRIYGLWQGYDTDSDTFDRNVRSLAELSGWEYCLLYPVDGTEETEKTRYLASAPMTMYRSLEISAMELPQGTYYMEFWVDDMFMRPMCAGRAKVLWDGQHVTIPADAPWEGYMGLQMTTE